MSKNGGIVVVGCICGLLPLRCILQCQRLHPGSRRYQWWFSFSGWLSPPVRLRLNMRTAEPPSRLLLALTGAVTALMHALPIGVVQFADYSAASRAR